MKRNAFTILEVMLAIFILTAAIGGSFILIQKTLFSVSQAQSKLIAAYLGQEGIEIVRNIRDTNWLEGLSWNNGLGEGEWEVDYNDLELSLFEDKYLNLDSAAGFYSYDLTDNPTSFKRKITISPIDGDKLEVSVEVGWTKRGRVYTIDPVVEHLYNWYGD